MQRNIAKRIEIIGVIASGKTTLAKQLANYGLIPIVESFRSNPFWKDFCFSPEKFLFETEIVFLLQHYNQIRKQNNERTYVCDYSLLLDLAYAGIGLSEDKFEIFKLLYNEIVQEINQPDLIIHLCCEPGISLERIKKRGRKEESHININFLSVLDNAINNQLRLINSDNIVKINSSEFNFRDGCEAIEFIANNVNTKVININCNSQE